MSGGQSEEKHDGTRASARRRRPASAKLLLGLAGLLAGATLVACEDTQACVPLGAGCTDADAFSFFFSAEVPCCEGTCTDQPPPPSNPDAVIKLCE